MVEIDEKRLPLSVLLDSSALVPALDPKHTALAGEDPACATLFQSLITNKCRVLIAAPSAAEIMRRSPESVIPRTRIVSVVPFDRLAANLLGTEFPPHVLTELAGPGTAPLHYIKYDAMIVACAVRHRLAEKVGLAAHPPIYYAQPQTSIFELPPQAQGTRSRERRPARASRGSRTTARPPSQPRAHHGAVDVVPRDRPAVSSVLRLGSSELRQHGFVARRDRWPDGHDRRV